MRTIVKFWRGEVPLARAFWLWGILGGAIVSLVSTLLALVVLAVGGPMWLAVIAFVVHLPWNLMLLVGVWRSAERAEVSRNTASLARLTILVWMVALSLV